MKSRITELLGIKYPIFQGGMAWVADGDLAGAVSNAGGLGIIGGGNAPKEVVKANIRILDIMAKKIDVSRDKFLANMMSYGNTSAASIPILLSENVANGTLKLDSGQTILLSGFGGGLTWGSLIVKI